MIALTAPSLSKRPTTIRYGVPNTPPRHRIPEHRTALVGLSGPAAERALTLADFVRARQAVNQVADASTRAQAQYELHLARSVHGDNGGHGYGWLRRSLEVAQGGPVRATA